MFKPIIIKDTNAERIMEQIRSVQGRATERIIDSFEQIRHIISEVENRIGDMKKNDLEETYFVYDFRHHFPRSYKYKAQSTHIKVMFYNGSWKLIDCDRYNCPNGNFRYSYELCLSETAKRAILERYK